MTDPQQTQTPAPEPEATIMYARELASPADVVRYGKPFPTAKVGDFVLNAFEPAAKQALVDASTFAAKYEPNDWRGNLRMVRGVGIYRTKTLAPAAPPAPPPQGP